MAKFAVSFLSAAAGLLFATEVLAQGCPAPQRLDFEVARKIERSEKGFTQGLEVREGRLLEGTGSIGGSTRLNVIDPTTGQVHRIVDVGTGVFGEGITVLKGELFQLTWQDGIVFVRDLQGRVLRQMRNIREGWGLTNDGENLIFSDGSGSLFVADPKTFAIKREIPVRAATQGAIRGINELELVGGKVLANLFTTWTIVRIDLATGCVEAFSDLRALLERMDPQERADVAGDTNNVLNGIAYDQRTDTYFLTGKRWRSIFAGRFRAAAP
jgi:glutaminyl-peptide cyclotransferase